MGNLLDPLMTGFRRVLRKSSLTETAGAILPSPAASVTPWLAHYPEGIDWNQNYTPAPLYDLIDRAADRYADRPALDFLGKKYNYEELAALINRATKGFQHLGVKKGVKVGLYLPNTPCFVICYFAILKAGGTVVNYNPLYVAEEIAWQIEDSETDILVTLDLKQLYPKAARMLAQTRLKQIIVCRMADVLTTLKGLLFSALKRSEIAAIPDDLQHIPFNKLLNNDGLYKAVEIEPEKDIAVLQYTGGTTGRPKGAMLTHANLSANTAQVRHWFKDMVEGEERILAVLPFFHVFAMTVVMNLGLSAGAEIIMLPRFDLDQVLKAINDKKPTVFPAVPTIYTAINHHEDISKFDLSSIRHCISGGAPLPAEVKDRFESLTGCSLVEGYGLSECSPVASCNPLSTGGKAGSIGIPLPATRIALFEMDKPGKVVKPGDKGEVCIKGPQVMTGYWGRDDATDRTIWQGWLRTGDIGTMDEDGYVFLVDRQKDLIISGGYNVYPRVIEEAIYKHEAVAEVIVIGIEDDYRGEVPKAFVKLKDGHQLNRDDLARFLTDHLSPIERPKEIEFRDELPKTMIGKLSKKELYAEEKAKKDKTNG